MSETTANQLPFGVDTNRLRQALVAARELENLTVPFKFLRGAEGKLAQFEQYGPFLARLVDEIGGQAAITDQEANELLPAQTLRGKMPATLRPLAAEGSELPGKLAMGAIRTVMEDETGQEWIASQLDKAQIVEDLDFENPRLQIMEDAAQLLNGVQAVARLEAAKANGRQVDPAHPDRGVKPEHVAIGLETMLRGIVDGDEQIMAAMPILGGVANKLLPKDPNKRNKFVPSRRMLTIGAHTIISAINDALPEEYQNLRLQKDAWRPNVLARTALFFARGTGALPAAREIGHRVIAHTLMAVPYKGSEVQRPYRTLRNRFPSKQEATV